MGANPYETAIPVGGEWLVGGSVSRESIFKIYIFIGSFVTNVIIIIPMAREGERKRHQEIEY